jgi:Raf kinase inhibitor-like YbhB/YbcL family protein
MAFVLRSAAFEHGQSIPARYTCEGDDVSPPLVWSGAPEGTRSFALVVDDPDAPDPAAPRTRWVHWVVYDIPASAGAIPEDARANGPPAGAREGVNDWKRTGWGGPCPPIGRHRYFHRLYALDAMLGDLGRPTRADLERAIRSHVLATAELIGTYEKSARSRR